MRTVSVQMSVPEGMTLYLDDTERETLYEVIRIC